MAARKKRRLQRYKATRIILWGDVPFRLEAGQEFTKADLQMPRMAAALKKWIRMGAAVEIVEEKQAIVKKK